MAEPAALLRHTHWRLFKDKAARYGVGIGGVGVIIAIALIFFYLLYVVIPLFASAEMDHVASYPTPGTGNTLHLSVEEQAEIGARVTDAGQVVFFDTHSGAVNKSVDLGVPEGARVTSLAAADPASRVLALGLSNGQVLAFRLDYKVTYPDNQRLITPQVSRPLGADPIVLSEQGRPLKTLAIQTGEDEATVAGLTADDQVILAHLAKQQSFLTGETTIEQETTTLKSGLGHADYLVISKPQRELYLANRNGDLSFYDISSKMSPTLRQHLRVVSEGQRLSSLELLAGGTSLLAGTSKGRISQWFPVRGEDNTYTLEEARSFADQHAPITGIAPEQGRRGFYGADRSGHVAIYHSTAHRHLLTKDVAQSAIRNLTVAPRADALLLQSQAGLQFWHVKNEHPEVSWSSLWTKVWYEGYEEPEYIWQSSAATSDFEPKFSLVPLTFGTLKAAFYAMLMAIPLSIMGAVYTAYFMSRRMRGFVKPTIEVMEALPTVILGFLAGLWLAPYIETHLPGIFALLLILPLGMLGFAYLWHHLPERIQFRVPEGWHGALMIPVVLILGWFALSLSAPLEHTLFGGDMRNWLTNGLGIDFDQRNSIVVGFAMGFAVIPTIFSITEDAIFSVPKHLTQGSLALGATPWQTLSRVVILTASPGIFSGVMIGFGRAVGETMIVLMATGNTPIMDFNIFEGMRTLSANIAVEMPESEVDSTHYRVLFLTALVLFLFTFVLNTLAEVVRQRLRNKYSSL